MTLSHFSFCKSGASALALSIALTVAMPAVGHEDHDHSKPVATLTNAAPAAQAADIVRDPTDLPPPITRRTPATVRVDLETIELEGQLADGTTFKYWTFNGKVPGPMIRVRIGDTVEVHLKNASGSEMMHNVDFHAVAGMHGGGHATQAAPGEEKGFTFKATKAGLYVYHCATPMVAQHISSGMYGMILVEPEEGLEKVSHEFYVMQGELYTDEAFGTKGEANFSPDKLMNERPEYFVFNGAVNTLSLQGPHKMHAKVGETVRIFFGVGGPNYTSSFHVIGTIFDNAYATGSLMTAPVQDVQTISVPPGGTTITEMTMQEPGDFVLVDHALVREERGLGGIIHVDGPENPAIFHEGANAVASAGKASSAIVAASIPAPTQGPSAAAAPGDAKGGAYEVKELNRGDKGSFVFAPDFVHIHAGESVTFRATDSGHSVETVAGMIPPGATPFQSKMNQDLKVAFDKPGVYVFECKPHTGMGMVGVVVVDDPVNIDAIDPSKMPNKAKQHLKELLEQVRTEMKTASR